MDKKIFYRVSNTETNQGLWYDMEGNFTGLIHTKFNFCLNHELPMPYDKEIVGWLSTTDELDALLHWFTKEDIIELTGVVEEVLPGSMYKVKIENMPNLMLCYTSGKLKQHKIRIILGDRVKVEVSPYDLSKGRVSYRL